MQIPMCCSPAGMRYAVIQRETRDAIVNRFFGIFFLFFQSSQVLGNLISSLVFSQDTSNSTGLGEDYACGAQDCYTGNPLYFIFKWGSYLSWTCATILLKHLETLLTFYWVFLMLTSIMHILRHCAGRLIFKNVCHWESNHLQKYPRPNTTLYAT